MRRGARRRGQSNSVNLGLIEAHRQSSIIAKAPPPFLPPRLLHHRCHIHTPRRRRHVCTHRLFHGHAIPQHLPVRQTKHDQPARREHVLLVVFLGEPLPALAARAQPVLLQQRDGRLARGPQRPGVVDGGIVARALVCVVAAGDVIDYREAKRGRSMGGLAVGSSVHLYPDRGRDSFGEWLLHTCTFLFGQK